MDDRIIILPFPDLWTFLGIGVFIFVLFILYMLGYSYLRRRAAKDARWEILLSFLLRQDLNTKEVEVIRGVYSSLSLPTQEEMISSTRRFHKLLTDRMPELTQLSVEERVKILEKLFPSTDHFVEIRSLADLMTGEVCAVEGGEDKFLGSVVKKSSEELMISIDDFSPVELLKGSPVGIYVYRPHVGGFLISGSIREIGPDFIIFKFDGQIEQKSGHHLMAEMFCKAVFKPWPQPEPGEKSEGHEIKGDAKIFSDRAIVFTAINEEDVHYYLNRHEIWNIATKLPGGYIFTCRGMIVPSKFFEKSFVFKFLDAGEIARNVLYTEIKEHDPVTERIG